MAFKRDGDYFLVGLVFSTHAMANLLFTFLFGKIMNIYGRRKLIIFSVFFYMAGHAGFGLLDFIQNK